MVKDNRGGTGEREDFTGEGSSKRQAGDVWHDIDNSVAYRVGKRVFYQLTDEQGGTGDVGGRKSLAFITATRGERTSDGLVCELIVFPVTGTSAIVGVKAKLDSARTPGTFDTAKDGDNKDQF